jgi:hypothetical protein
MAKRMTGRVDKQEAVATQADEFVTYESDTFSITVKDDEGKEVYKNDAESFKYPKVVGLANYLRHKGAKLTDDQITFLGEALKGDETIDTAYKELIEDLNGLLFARAKQSAYSRVLNEHKPISEETISNSQARMVRDFVRQNPTVSAASAIEVLKQFVPSMKDYTLAQFEANKGRV